MICPNVSKKENLELSLVENTFTFKCKLVFPIICKSCQLENISSVLPTLLSISFADISKDASILKNGDLDSKYTILMEN